MKILVLGAEGMLGHKMFQLLSQRFQGTWGTVRHAISEPLYQRIPLFGSERVVAGVDAMDLAAVERRLEEIRPDAVVNCVGVVKQRDEAKDAIPTITLNSLLPHRLAARAARWGGRFVHVSTDCVFSGRRGNYAENDVTDAEDLYGRSKALGEVVREGALTLRTSIIGRELANFRSLLEWFLDQEGKNVRGFRRVIYSGVTTNYLANVIGTILTDHPRLSGLYQVVSPPITKHDLLCCLRDAYRLNVEIVPDDSEVSDRSMSGEKFRGATGIPMPRWDSLVAQLASDPTPYPEWRTRP